MIEEVYRGYRGYREESGLKKWNPATGTILDILHPSPMEWIDQADLDEGAACHKEMEAQLRLIQDPLATVERSENPLMRVHNFIGWFLDQNLEIVAIETSVLCKAYGFAGRPDLVIRDRKKTGRIFEVKFAEQGVTRRYQAQVESYTHLDPYKGFEPWLIQVTRAGEVIPHPQKPNHREWAGFLGALAVLRCRME
jgi:hypothetical protein